MSNILFPTGSHTQSTDKLVPQDVFEEMYVAFANILVTDQYIQQLLEDGSYVFDFLPFESIKAMYTKPPLSTIPANAPHINLMINRLGYQLTGSNCKRGEIEMTIVYESPMHWVSTYKLMSYLSSLLVDTVFTAKDTAVRVMSSSATPNYNTSKNSVTVTQSVQIAFEIARRR